MGHMRKVKLATIQTYRLTIKSMCTGNKERGVIRYTREMFILIRREPQGREQ